MKESVISQELVQVASITCFETMSTLKTTTKTSILTTKTILRNNLNLICLMRIGDVIYRQSANGHDSPSSSQRQESPVPSFSQQQDNQEAPFLTQQQQQQDVDDGSIIDSQQGTDWDDTDNDAELDILFSTSATTHTQGSQQVPIDFTLDDLVSQGSSYNANRSVQVTPKPTKPDFDEVIFGASSSTPTTSQRSKKSSTTSSHALSTSNKRGRTSSAESTPGPRSKRDRRPPRLPTTFDPDDDDNDDLNIVFDPLLNRRLTRSQLRASATPQPDASVYTAPSPSPAAFNPPSRALSRAVSRAASLAASKAASRAASRTTSRAASPTASTASSTKFKAGKQSMLHRLAHKKQDQIKMY
ncbi:hypothetical protein FB192DRAFT_1441239, partial [Mucor lusitanicus]